METAQHNKNFKYWFRISVFNLLLVSVLGILMRYKIAYSLPVINQRYLLNAHSHFAFAGWVSQALMVLVAYYIYRQKENYSGRTYNFILSANLFAAYGMLFSFPFEGYATVSIIFSTLSLFVSYAFAFQVWRDLNGMKHKSIAHKWLKAGLIFNALSSLGPYALAYMMASKNIVQDIYLGSVYFFLHFQYNGWFFFAAMGLIMTKIESGIIPPKTQQTIFYLFALSCLPAYFLSALWMPIPAWLYALVILSAFAQVAGWFIFLRRILKKGISILPAARPVVKYLFSLSVLAMTIKLFLQLGSTIPKLGTWAFGFRPIIIGYLHLVFLGVFSLFLLGYGIWQQFLPVKRLLLYAIWIFVAGIFLNEIFLLAEGLGAITYNPVPYVNQWLLAAACIMFAGLLLLNLSTYLAQRQVFKSEAEGAGPMQAMIS